MSSTSLRGNIRIVDDIRNCRDGLMAMRADYVQAFAAGENGPFAWKELSQLQSIVMAFDAVIDWYNGLQKPADTQDKFAAVIEDVRRVASLREAGPI
ncbi:hypothetical protein [Agrobacterium tumefaciens]|uniref:hypothetical protein n=1 Tax=Agrobacterium tumefaciens TaxID=358 RepID=UPI00097883FA|nr:hypothetical protein [Agrobacterium tumefaciens]NSZ68737.1 hypothetical protein [Agrobacterium tumefaciens]OMP69502.1 hypothetical protein BV900_24715 [Agrobacterium tumefaciens]